MYQARLMDHYRSPLHRGAIAEPTFTSKVHNPSCGDMVQLQGKVREGIIHELKFTGAGCVISQAAASILCEHAQGKPLADLKSLDAQTMKDMVGIPLGPTRLRCALLALEALQSNA